MKKREENLKRGLSISYFAFEDKCPTAILKKVLQDRIKYIPARNGIKTVKNSIRNNGHENTYKITLGRREFSSYLFKLLFCIRSNISRILNIIYGYLPFSYEHSFERLTCVKNILRGYLFFS